MIEIQLKRTSRRYMAQLASEKNKKRTISALIDTGARSTVLTERDMRVLLVDDIRKYEEVKSTAKRYIINTYNGGVIETIPIVIRGCILNNVSIQNLYCFVCDDKKAALSVIGMDFITACSISISKDSNLKILTIDPDMYKESFTNDCKGHIVNEVNLLSSGSSINDLLKSAEGNRY